MDKKLIMKLAKVLAKFDEISTDKGVLTIDGELAIEAEVYIYTEEGEPMPAEDGEYLLEDGRLILIKDGKIAEIKVEEEAPAEEAIEEEAPAEEMEEEIAPVEEIVEEPIVDERDARIAELEALLAERDEEIAKLKAQLEELNKPLEEPVEMSKTVKAAKTYDNPALRYFE